MLLTCLTDDLEVRHHPCLVMLEDLEKESVQVGRVIHQRGVDDVPHLQLADLDRLVVMVALFVDDEAESAAEAHFETQLHGSRRARGSGDERGDLAQPRRHARSGCLSWGDADRPETFDALLPGHAVVRQVLDGENFTFLFERTDC